MKGGGVRVRGTPGNRTIGIQARCHETLKDCVGERVCLAYFLITNPAIITMQN